MVDKAALLHPQRASSAAMAPVRVLDLHVRAGAGTQSQGSRWISRTPGWRPADHCGTASSSIIDDASLGADRRPAGWAPGVGCTSGSSGVSSRAFLPREASRLEEALLPALILFDTSTGSTSRCFLNSLNSIQATTPTASAIAIGMSADEIDPTMPREAAR